MGSEDANRAVLSYPDAAEEILRRHSRGAPLHYREITRLAIEEALIQPGGLTPAASMNAAINQDIRRRESAQREQRFRAYGRGMYGLARVRDPLGGALSRRNSEVRERLKALLADMDPYDFEALIGQLLTALGFEEVQVKRRSADGGIDVTGTLTVGGVTQVQTAIQVKRWKRKVTGRTVRELRGGIGPHERGLIVTLSGFTPDARRDAGAEDRVPISLIDGERLVELLVEHEIGVTLRTVMLLELDEGALLPTGVAEDDSVERARLGRPVPRTEKSLSVWPLPGGSSKWKDTLDTMLDYVGTESPTLSEAMDWIIRSYGRVTSEKVARGYWQVPRSFGLIETHGEELALTSEGAVYSSGKSAAELLDIIETKVAGFREIRGYLAERPHAAEEILQRLREDLGVGWETTAQVNFRLGWLENLGMVRSSGGLWQLVDSAGSAPLEPWPR